MAERLLRKIGATSKAAEMSAGAKRRSVVKPVDLPDGMWERVAQKAYALWEERGQRDGQDLRDWLDAEEIVMEEMHEARE